MFSLILTLCSGVYGQNSKVNKKLFRFDKSVIQNKSVFKFWHGLTDSTRKKLVIERSSNGRDTILYDDYIRDGIYKVADRNNDGYMDFITNYHDYDVIYFFDNKKNLFKETPVYMPMTLGLVATTKKIYWGYRRAQYSEPSDYSILYKYNGFVPYFFAKIQFITAEGLSGGDNVTNIKLFTFINGNMTT